jgi:hypothetical protein
MLLHTVRGRGHQTRTPNAFGVEIPGAFFLQSILLFKLAIPELTFSEWNDFGLFQPFCSSRFFS